MGLTAAAGKDRASGPTCRGQGLVRTAATVYAAVRVIADIAFAVVLNI